MERPPTGWGVLVMFLALIIGLPIFAGVSNHDGKFNLLELTVFVSMLLIIIVAGIVEFVRATIWLERKNESIGRRS